MHTHVCLSRRKQYGCYVVGGRGGVQEWPPPRQQVRRSRLQIVLGHTLRQDSWRHLIVTDGLDTSQSHAEAGRTGAMSSYSKAAPECQAELPCFLHVYLFVCSHSITPPPNHILAELTSPSVMMLAG